MDATNNNNINDLTTFNPFENVDRKTYNLVYHHRVTDLTFAEFLEREEFEVLVVFKSTNERRMVYAYRQHYRSYRIQMFNNLKFLRSMILSMINLYFLFSINAFLNELMNVSLQTNKAKHKNKECRFFSQNNIF